MTTSKLRTPLTRRRVLTVAGVAVAVVMLYQAFDRPTTQSADEGDAMTPEPQTNILTPPTSGRIPVAFLISHGVTVIDFAGPWEVFQDVPGQRFDLCTVSAALNPLRGSADLQLVPDYTFEDAPSPKVIVVPAQQAGPAYGEWLRQTYAGVDVPMSVCTGAFILTAAGLLEGHAATTHHDFFEQFEAAFPDVELRHGLRFVEGEKVSTAGGLTSGIDLALRVVERYFGRDVAQRTAAYMEYQSTGWQVG